MEKHELSRYRAALEAELARLTQHGLTVAPEPDDRPEELPDPTDRATRQSEVESAQRLRDRERKLASKIRGALERIEAGTFGNCLSCGTPIAPERLRARPVTDLCIDCKREAERSEGR